MSLIGTCSDCGTGGVSLRYKPEVPINEQSRPSICDRCRDFREEQATHYVPCEECGDRLPSERAHSLDVTAEDEYYPEFIHFCPACAPEANDDDGELVTDGGQPAEDGQAVYQCDRCGDEFRAHQAAKKHVVVEEMQPVNPEEVISRV